MCRALDHEALGRIYKIQFLVCRCSTLHTLREEIHRDEVGDGLADTSEKPVL